MNEATPAGVDPQKSPNRSLPLQILVVVVFFCAVLEGFFLLRLHQRVELVVDRMQDLQIADQLGLPASSEALLTITADDLPFTLRDLRSAQVRANDWLDDFCTRYALEPAIIDMLRGVLARYLMDYGNTRVSEALGGIPPQDLSTRYSSLHTRYREAIATLVSPDIATAFDQELKANWDSWMDE